MTWPRAGGLAVAVLVAAGCAGGAARPSPSAATPDGEQVLQRACTACHGLDGLRAYADYWAEPEWREMIDTMISYGAELTDDEYEVLARYLAERYWPDDAPTAGRR